MHLDEGLRTVVATDSGSDCKERSKRSLMFCVTCNRGDGRKSDTFHYRWKVQCSDGEMPIVGPSQFVPTSSVDEDRTDKNHQDPL